MMNISNISTIDSQTKHHLQHLSQPINPPKITRPFFPNKAKLRCLTSSDLINIKKRKPKMISTIQLNLFGIGDLIENIGLRNLRRAITDNKCSSSLIIKRHYHWYSQYTKKIDRLFTATSHWKTIKLYYNDSQAMPTNEDLKSLASLKKYKNLYNFEIMLNCNESNKNTILDMLQKQMKNLRNLKGLTIDISQCKKARFMTRIDQNYDENATTLTFKFPTTLSSLKIVLGEGDFKTEMLSQFAQNIPASLQHLTLDILSLYHELDLAEGKAWASLFENTKNLKTLNLTVDWPKNFIDNGDQIFLEGLQNLKQLTSLNLIVCFPPSSYSTEIFLHDLFLHLSSLPNLTALNLQYIGFKIPEDSAFLNLFSSLKSLTKLQQFSLFCTISLKENDPFLSQLAFALQYLQNLQKFHLCLADSVISETGIASLSKSLKKLPHIKDLNLDFDRCSLQEKSLQILSENINHLNLTSLKLILPVCEKPKSFLERLVIPWKEPKDQKRFACFCLALDKFNALSALSLNLSTLQVNTKEFLCFSNALKGLKNLASLSLELPQFTSGNNFEGFTSFALILRDLQKLKLLHLTALKGAKLRDQEVIFLYLNVKACRFLKDLKLCFEQADLSDECLPSIGLGIRDLLSLKHLNISFGNEQKFKTGKVLKLLESIAVLKKLKTIEFQYSSYTGSEFGDLCQTKIKYLQDFVINGCHYQTQHF